MRTIPTFSGARTALIVTALSATMLAGGATSAPQSAAEIDDPNLADAVADEIAHEQGVESSTIQATAEDGVVTLSGTVQDLLAKRRAETIAGTVLGVKSVENELTVNPPEDLQSDRVGTMVVAALAADPATESWEIDVETDSEGHVALSGRVQSGQEARLAERVAMSVAGVTGVTNALTIEPAVTRSDGEIREDVTARLDWSALFSDEYIDVAVADGVVHLSGDVFSAAERARAVSEAHVRGVTGVDASGLKVAFAENGRAPANPEPGQPRDDAAIRQAVQSALMANPRVDRGGTETFVDDGVVTLRGGVDNLAAKEAAGDAAGKIIGVERVENRMHVNRSKPMSDPELEQDIVNAFIRHPDVEASDFVVKVRNGVVSLYGNVDSFFEQSQAYKAASRVGGVARVENHMDVRDNVRPFVSDLYADNVRYESYDWWSDYREPRTMKSDAEIAAAIRDELSWSPFVLAENVEIVVQDGRATLGGTVNSVRARQAAIENAWEGGAVWVRNEIEVAAPRS